MSFLEWESGTIQLPKTQYGKIKKSFITAYNQSLEKELKNALRLHAWYIKEFKGKRNIDVLGELHSARFSFEIENDTIFLMFNNKTNKIRKPLRKDMGFAKYNRLKFSNDEVCIFFDIDNKTVSWNVSENNHACEYARESELGKIFFTTMNNVNWTNGSGGEIIGNDEYNSDDMSVGGGGNYITTTFGNGEQRW